jgi:hypothetical protein
MVEMVFIPSVGSFRVPQLKNNTTVNIVASTLFIVKLFITVIFLAAKIMKIMVDMNSGAYILRD